MNTTYLILYHNYNIIYLNICKNIDCRNNTRFNNIPIG